MQHLAEASACSAPPCLHPAPCRAASRASCPASRSTCRWRGRPTTPTATCWAATRPTRCSAACGARAGWGGGDAGEGHGCAAAHAAAGCWRWRWRSSLSAPRPHRRLACPLAPRLDCCAARWSWRARSMAGHTARPPLPPTRLLPVRRLGPALHACALPARPALALDQPSPVSLSHLLPGCPTHAQGPCRRRASGRRGPRASQGCASSWLSSSTASRR